MAVGRYGIAAVRPVLAMLGIAGTAMTQATVDLEAPDGGRFRIVPGDLSVEHVDATGATVPLALAISSPGRIDGLRLFDAGARWSMPDLGLTVEAVLDHGRLRVRIVRDESGSLTWPSVPCRGARGVALPAFEGVWVPAGDARMSAWLRDQGTMRVTEALTLPVFGVARATRTITCLLSEPFYDDLEFEGTADTLTARVTHHWTPNRSRAVHEVVFVVTTDSGLLAPALAYRQWLADRGELVTLEQKIAEHPAAARLPGAIHAYLWGDATFSRHAMDRRGWREFSRAVVDAAPADTADVAARLLQRLPEDAREALREMAKTEYPSRYAQDVAARGIAGVLADPHFAGDRSAADPAAVYERNARALRERFPSVLPEPSKWGDGCSIPLLEQLAAAGIDRAVLCSSDLDDSLVVPDFVHKARDLGFLFGPYDSYHSIHSPDAGENATWRTAQFDRELYENGRVVGLDGEPSRGFLERGFHLSSAAAFPWVKRRVAARLARAPYGAWFVDCDGFGQFFDDAHPDHPATRAEDAAARRARLCWLADEHGLVVGSEGATAVMAPALHFAHGVLTPVFGWGDPILTERSSEYWLGGYWPPDEPAVFFRSVPVHDEHRRPYFDPRDRLPLYRAALGDCVVTTHHWARASRKFAGENGTRSLLELLYAAPPLYHLNRGTWAEDRDAIVAHHRFFAPLHRILATCPLTDFTWLTEDRMVQCATYARASGSVSLIANFDATDRALPEGGTVPARTLIVQGAPDLEEPSFSVR